MTVQRVGRAADAPRREAELRSSADAALTTGNERSSDAEAVARVLRGDTEAFGLLIRRYEPGLLRFATRLLASSDDAEGAVAEGFVRAYRHLSGCRGLSNLRAWLYGIVANRCKTYLARSRTAHVPLDGASSVAAPVHGVAVLEHREELAVVEKALASIPSEQREVCLLKHVEGLSYTEIAAVTGRRIGALKMRGYRAREALLKALDRPQPEWRNRE